MIVPRSRPSRSSHSDNIVAPQRGFFHAFELGQVEVRAAARAERRLRAIGEIERGVDERSGDGFAIDGDVPFGQMQPARSNDQHRKVNAEAVILAGARIGEGERPAHRSVRLTCPWTSSSQVGAVASSKSAMKTLAPLLSALMTILALVGPVISTAGR